MKHIQTKLLIAIITGLMFSHFSCAQQHGALGEKTIELDKFDFSTPITEIFPNRYVDHAYGDNWYRIPSPCFGSNLYFKETCYNDSEDTKLWILYRYQASCSADEFLSMEGRIFNAANFATTLDGRIFAVGGNVSEISETASDDFIARLSKHYGDPIRTKETFGNLIFNIYTWTLNDRILKYETTITDESNVLKIEKTYNDDGSLADIHEGERKTKLQSYFFVIDTTWVDRFLADDHSTRGDFGYCK